MNMVPSIVTQCSLQCRRLFFCFFLVTLRLTAGSVVLQNILGGPFTKKKKGVGGVALVLLREYFKTQGH